MKTQNQSHINDQIVNINMKVYFSHYRAVTFGAHMCANGRITRRYYIIFEYVNALVLPLADKEYQFRYTFLVFNLP